MCIRDRTQPQEPLIEPASQASEQPEPETPEAEPEADTLPESETEPAQDSPEESEPEETPAQEDPGEKTYTPASVTDATKTLDLELYSENALLIDLESNTVLVQKNADASIYPASMTKVMTVLVAAEHIENWDETFTMTQSIIDPLFLADASMAGFVHGEAVSMTELLYGAVLPSGAEATEALAIVTAGSEEAFAALMNEKAQALGLKDTHFVDASGLHDENHYTTLSDMAVSYTHLGDLKMWYDEKKRKAGESHAKRSADRPPADHGGNPRDARAGCAREKETAPEKNAHNHRRHAARDHASCRAGAFCPREAANA